MRDRALLDSPQLVADVRSQLELLGLDRSLEPIAKLGRAGHVREFCRKGRHVAAPDMPGIPVHSPQEIAQTDLERLVAVRAAESAGRAEIGKGCLTERALRRLAFGSRHLLVKRLEKIVDLRFRRG